MKEINLWLNHLRKLWATIFDQLDDVLKKL